MHRLRIVLKDDVLRRTIKVRKVYRKLKGGKPIDHNTADDLKRWSTDEMDEHTINLLNEIAMKEIEDSHKDNVEITQQQEKENKLIGSLKIHKGQTLYKVNLKTGEISEAEFKSEYVDYTAAIKKDLTAIRKVLIVEDNHKYVPALNKSNAERKFKDMLLRRF